MNVCSVCQAEIPPDINLYAQDGEDVSGEFFCSYDCICSWAFGRSDMESLYLGPKQGSI